MRGQEHDTEQTARFGNGKHSEYGMQRFGHHPRISLSSEVKIGLVTCGFKTCIMCSSKRLVLL